MISDLFVYWLMIFDAERRTTPTPCQLLFFSYRGDFGKQQMKQFINYTYPNIHW
jgi:hypothetical protein